MQFLVYIGCRVISLLQKRGDTVQLSKREISITLTLIDANGPLTTALLAEQFEMSVRSIKYDLDNIRAWLEQKKLSLVSRRNKGIWLEWPDSKKLEIKNELLHVARYALFPDQEVRIYRLILRLALAETFLTSDTLADDMSVSRNTILSDLEKMELLLYEYDVTLQRRNHYGFCLAGEESQIRLLMEIVIQKGMTDYDVYNMMQTIVNQEKTQATNYGMPHEMATIFNVTLTEMAQLVDQEMLDQFNYSEILAIILRVAIATGRLKNTHTMKSYKILDNQQQLEQKRELPFLLMQAVFNYYHFPNLEDEYIYIFSDILINYQDANIAELTTALIAEVSEKEQVPFNADQQLFNNLFAHLSLKLHKKHVFVNEYNPFVDDIKSKYSHLFRHIQFASEKLIASSAVIVNDSFVSYIALHFLVAYEKAQPNRDVVSIVYICSTGLGVTSLIQQKIMEEVANVELVSFASVLKAQEVIKEKNPDLVVSIFPLEGIQRPFIKVQPLPTVQDITMINELVQGVLQNRSGEHKLTRLVARQQVPNKQGIEDESRDLLLSAFVVYEELKRLFEGQIQSGYEEAFLLHVMMMVHRIHFQSQYQNEGNVVPETLVTNQTDVCAIEKIMAHNKLAINRAEITALLQYVCIE